MHSTVPPKEENGDNGGDLKRAQQKPGTSTSAEEGGVGEGSDLHTEEDAEPSAEPEGG